MVSLQRRLVFGGGVWAIGITIAGTFALLSAFDQIAQRGFDTDILERHAQIVVALEQTEDPALLENYILDPGFSRTYSGLYWQVVDSEGNIFTSRSLFDQKIDMPTNEGQLSTFEASGPLSDVRGVSQRISIGTDYHVAVAKSVLVLEAERGEMRRSLAFGFGFVGLLGLLAALYLVNIIVAPIVRLRKDVAMRWEKAGMLNPDTYPTEVAPFVSDINELMGRNQKIVQQGRRQAADLAHALKTPSSALRNEINSLRQADGAKAKMLEALDKIDGQITRSLARMRAYHSSEGLNLKTNIANSFSRLERLFRSLPKAREISLDFSSDASVNVAVDIHDLEEILGNLVENGIKWAETSVKISAVQDDGRVIVRIEDDGPGISPDQRNAVLVQGARLDVRKSGSGLGLSIADDLTKAYGGHILLGASQTLGGLMVTVELPAQNEIYR